MAEQRAIIRWLSSQEGGRRSPPMDATGYTAPARFIQHYDEFRTEGWSLRVTEASWVEEGIVCDAKVSFDAAKAPRRWLKPGARFELLEGSKVVATGVVVPKRVKIPKKMTDFERALLA